MAANDLEKARGCFYLIVIFVLIAFGKYLTDDVKYFSSYWEAFFTFIGVFVSYKVLRAMMRAGARSVCERKYKKRLIEWFGKDKESPETLTILVKDDNGKVPLVIRNPYEHILCVAGSGSGKTKSVAEPLITTALVKGFSGVIYDYKSPQLGDFVNRIDGSVRKLSLDFISPECSDRFDIMGEITDPISAQELAHSLLSFKDKDTFFSIATTTYLAAVLYHFRQHSLPHIMAYILNESVGDIVNKLSNDSQSKMMIRPVKDSMQSEKQLAGITATLSSKLMPYMNEKIFWVLSGKESLKVNEISDPKLVVLANDPRFENSLKPLLSSIAILLTKTLNRQNKHKSIFLIDELSTLEIPGLDRFMSTVRSNKVSCILLYQDQSQLETNYDKAKANAITANCAYKFFGKNTNPATMEAIQKMFGEHEAINITHSVSGKRFESKTKSAGQSIIKRQTYTNEQIINLEKGEFILLFPHVLKDDVKHSITPLEMVENLPKRERKQKASAREIELNYRTIMAESENM